MKGWEGYKKSLNNWVKSKYPGKSFDYLNDEDYEEIFKGSLRAMAVNPKTMDVVYTDSDKNISLKLKESFKDENNINDFFNDLKENTSRSFDFLPEAIDNFRNKGIIANIKKYYGLGVGLSDYLNNNNIEKYTKISADRAHAFIGWEGYKKGINDWVKSKYPGKSFDYLNDEDYEEIFKGSSRAMAVNPETMDVFYTNKKNIRLKLKESFKDENNINDFFNDLKTENTSTSFDNLSEAIDTFRTKGILKNKSMNWYLGVGLSDYLNNNNIEKYTKISEDRAKFIGWEGYKKSLNNWVKSKYPGKSFDYLNDEDYEEIFKGSLRAMAVNPETMDIKYTDNEKNIHLTLKEAYKDENIINDYFDFLKNENTSRSFDFLPEAIDNFRNKGIRKTRPYLSALEVGISDYLNNNNIEKYAKLSEDRAKFKKLERYRENINAIHDYTENLNDIYNDDENNLKLNSSVFSSKGELSVFLNGTKFENEIKSLRNFSIQNDKKSRRENDIESLYNFSIQNDNLKKSKREENEQSVFSKIDNLKKELIGDTRELFDRTKAVDHEISKDAIGQRLKEILSIKRKDENNIAFRSLRRGRRALLMDKDIRK